MKPSGKLKLPLVRLLTAAENQQLSDLAEEIARKILGPAWKELQQNDQRRELRQLTFGQVRKRAWLID
jgi:hypothetical protein